MKRLITVLVILIGTLPGMSRHYDITTQRISTADGLPTNIVGQIWQTADGMMWFETRSGICRYDGYTLSCIPLGSVSSPRRADNVTTTRDAQWRREGKGRFSRIGRNGEKATWQLIPEDIIAYTRNDHFHVADVDERTEAISTYGAGLFLYDKPTGELTNISKGLLDNTYLTQLFVDATGCIWVVEDYLGIKCLRMSRLRYLRHQMATGTAIQEVNHIRCIAPLGDGRLLVGSQTADMFVYDTRDGNTSYIKNMGSRVYDALTDRHGRQWIGTRGNGLWCDGKQVGGLPSANIYRLIDDGSDGLWIALLGGGVARRHPDGSTELFLKGKDCHDLLRDGNNRLWVAAEDSLYIINKKGEKWTERSVMSGYFVCLCRAADGTIWAGSIGGGLVGCGRKTHRYTISNGLSNNNVYAVVEDRRGRIWAGTEEGLFCLNTATGDIRNHTFSENPLTNVFSEKTAVCLADGRLLFGTHDGIIEIDTEEDAPPPSPPHTAITGLTVNGQPWPQADNNSESVGRLSQEGTFKMDYTQNSLTFSFSNFQYAWLQSVLYQYRLDPIDKDWTPPTMEHTAVYRNLRPGQYVFRVRSNNGMGSWGEESKITITVSQPWWNTAWAWFLYVVGVGCLAIAAGVLSRRMMRLHRQIEVERQVSDFKTDFYNRIERELRNPINVVQGATENVQIGGTSKTTVRSLRRGSRRMLKLMDMMRQFNKGLTPQGEDYEQRFADIVNMIHADEDEFKELPPPPINELSILIVDEDEDNLTHLCDTLSPYFKVIGCRLLNHCSEMVAEHRPSVVLLDIGKNEKLARELTRSLHTAYPSVPVIHLSPFDDDVHQLLSLRSGAADYLVKPFSGRVLVERIKRGASHYSTLEGVTEASPSASKGGTERSRALLTSVKDKKFLDRFEALLARHVGEDDFSVEQVAAQMGLGRTQLYKRVKALTGETPVVHLHRARLAYAARLLLESRATVEEVMGRAGFHSANHFYQSFKQQYGLSPSDYRHTAPSA